MRPARGGQLVIVQPNFTYCACHYFDDYTHVSVFTHVSPTDFFEAQGFTPVCIQPRFLPFSMKSRLPPIAWTIRLYVALPVRQRAVQMLVALEKR